MIELGLVQDAVARGETLHHTVTNDIPPIVSWLSGLCDEMQTQKVPPLYRQLIGFNIICLSFSNSPTY
jgi:hypothetical protein